LEKRIREEEAIATAITMLRGPLIKIGNQYSFSEA
jgi:hypothetical protein